MCDYNSSGTTLRSNCVSFLSIESKTPQHSRFDIQLDDFVVLYGGSSGRLVVVVSGSLQSAISSSFFAVPPRVMDSFMLSQKHCKKYSESEKRLPTAMSGLHPSSLLSLSTCILSLFVLLDRRCLLLCLLPALFLSSFLFRRLNADEARDRRDDVVDEAWDDTDDSSSLLFVLLFLVPLDMVNRISGSECPVRNG